MSVATFAFFNAPFKVEVVSSNGSATPITPRPVVTEKKGLDYVPEPLPRPTSVPTPQPEEKR